MASEELEAINDLLRDLDNASMTLEEQRAVFDAGNEAVPAGTILGPAGVDGVACEWVAVPDPDPTRIIVSLGGGGYCLGSLKSNRRFSALLSQATSARVLNVGYRRAPEHRFPAALEDACAAYRWLVGSGTNPANIALAGNSAGGGLALALLLALRDAGDPLPACAAVASPWTDLAVTGESVRTNADSEVMLDVTGMASTAALYVDEAQLTDPYVSPLYGDLRGLPPLLLHVSGSEILLDDSLRFAHRARAHGTAAEVVVTPEMPHVWHLFAGLLPEADAALADLGRWITDHIDERTDESRHREFGEHRAPLLRSGHFESGRSMKAQVVHELEGIDSLHWEEVADPAVPAGHVEIAVRAAALNFPDLLIIQGLYQVRPELPFSPGAEAAGDVVAVGDGVTGFTVGDRVIGYSSHGAMAERFVVPSQNAFKLPTELSYEQGASLAMTYGTSYHALFDRAKLTTGETLLVTGATGGVGSAAMQLGKAVGARVIGAVGSEAKAEAARQFGADDVVLYGGDHSLKDQVKELTDGAGADVIYDAVGGDVFLETLRCVAWEGRILVVGFTSGTIPQAPMNLPLLKGCSIVGVFWGDFARRDPAANAANFAEVFEMAVDGRIEPAISETFPIEQAREALGLLASRKAIGKVVLTVAGE